MGRKSRLKRKWRLERLARQLESEDAEARAPTPLSDEARLRWIVVTAMSVAVSFASLGTQIDLKIGLLPFLLVVCASSIFERRRGRPRHARLWLAAGAAWWVGLVVLKELAMLVNPTS